MRILHLNLYRNWFDLIATRMKPVEFRKATPYWKKRLFEKNGMSKKFDQIYFRNGYGKDRPLMVTGFVSSIITHSDLCDPKNGEELDGLTIVIGLGEILRFENYTPEAT